MLEAVLIGAGGSILKDLLWDKIYNKDFSWFTKMLFCFMIIYLFMTCIDNPIYLDSKDVNVTLGEVKFVVTGEYIERIITQFGSVSAFVVGAQLAAGFVMKHPMSIPGKIGTSLLVGGISSASFQMVSLGNGIIRGNLSSSKSASDTLVLEVNNVEISKTQAPEGIFQKLSDLTEHVSTSEMIRPKFSGFRLNSTLDNSFIQTAKGTKSVSDLIKDENLCDNFFKQSIKMGDNTDLIFIESPLEPSLQNDLVTILSYNLLVNLTISYFVLLLTLALTVRFVIDIDSFLNKFKS